MQENVRAKSALKNTIWGYVYIGVNSLFPFVIRTLIIQYWGMDYLGLNSLFVSILQVLNISELGIGQALAVYLYKPVANNDTEEINKILSLYDLLYKAIGVIMIIIAICLVPFLPIMIKGECPDALNLYLVYFLYIGQAVIGYIIFPYTAIAFSVNQQEHVMKKVNLSIWLIMFPAQIAVVCLTSSYYFYLISLVIVPLLVGIIMRIVLLKCHRTYRIVRIRKKSFTSEFWNGFLKKIFAMTFSKIRNAVRTSLDTIVISAYIGLVAAAQYQNYLLVATVPIMLVETFTGAIIPSLGNAIVTDGSENALGIVKFSYFLVHCITTVFGCVLVCFCQPFMRIWAGEGNVLSSTYMILFTVYYYFRSMTEVNVMFRNSTGIWWEGKWIPLTETVVNIILNIVLVVLWGVEGVLFATIISICFVNIPFETYCIYKKFNGSCSIKNILCYYGDFAISAIIIYATYIISRLFYNGVVLTSIVWGMICLVVPCCLLLVFHVRNENVKEVIRYLKKFSYVIRQKLKH